MFERFTERARQVVVLAQEEARTLGFNYIGTQHILLGILREEEGLGSRALESFDVTVEAVHALMESQLSSEQAPEGVELRGNQIPFTPRAKKVLELALREALSFGHNYIGTEHILLGLVRENDGNAKNILDELGVKGEKIRNEVIRMLSGPGGRRSVAPRDLQKEDLAEPQSVKTSDIVAGGITTGVPMALATYSPPKIIVTVEYEQVNGSCELMLECIGPKTAEGMVGDALAGTLPGAAGKLKKIIVEIS